MGQGPPRGADRRPRLGTLDHEYLYWVGCATSFDDRNKKVAVATAKLLQRAGLDFAILGQNELCTGDPARRSGNEYVFQMLALENMDTLNGLGVKKIIASCPHCFNTLKNEYPGWAATTRSSTTASCSWSWSRTGACPCRRCARRADRLPRLLLPGPPQRRVPGAPQGGRSIAGVEVVEMPRNGNRGLCCGAGGARMWMEERTGKKVNIERTEEALGTGAYRIATACPFCNIMLDDGVKEKGADEQVKVADISMVLLEAIEGVPEPGRHQAAPRPRRDPRRDRWSSPASPSSCWKLR